MIGLGLDARRLAALLPESPGGGPVVSLYLAPDPGSGVSTEGRVKQLAKEGEAAIQAEAGLDAATRERARAALERGAAAIAREAANHPRDTCVAFGGDRVETFHVPCALKSRVVMGQHAFVGPLADLLERAERYGLVLADRRETRIFASFMGELTPIQSFEDPSLQNVAWAGWYGRDQLKANHHREVVLHRHLQHAADSLFLLHKTSPFDRIVIAGHTPATLNQLEKCLHPYLAARIVARESWGPRATVNELRAHLAEIVERVETEKERSLLSRVRDHVAGDLHAATGADATLTALWGGRVATLIAPGGTKLPGLACEKCRFLAAESGQARREAARCRECGGPTRAVPDLVEEASELAVLTGAKVRLIERAKADLESLGGFAALLRYV